jgi:hypothetical protein
VVVWPFTRKISGTRRNNVDRSRKAPVFAAVIFRRVQRRRHALRSADSPITVMFGVISWCASRSI